MRGPACRGPLRITLIYDGKTERFVVRMARAEPLGPVAVVIQ